MSTQKILVTGGVGFIGIHTVVELVSAGFEPIIADDLSRSNISLLHGAEKILGRKLEFFNVNCADRQSLEKIFTSHRDIGGVIHFAAFKSVNESVEQPLLYYRNNLTTLLTVLEAVKNHSVGSFIFSSSCTVYGQPDQIPVTEETPFKEAESPYGTTKQMCEQILQDVSVTPDAPSIISLRYFNPIGAHPSALIGELPIGVPANLVPYITQTAIGKRDKLTIFGTDYSTPDGSCLRDFIHVVDLAKAHIKALQKIEDMPTRFVAINVGTGKPVSVLELVKTFIKVTGVDLHYAVGPRRPGDIEKVYADTTKSRKLLNWKAELTIEDSLRDAWNWEQKMKHANH
jgi:UDP-glucose 4-epimerase